MKHVVRALKVAVAISRAKISEGDRYDLFATQFRSSRPGAALSEREIRDAYLQWRLAGFRDEQTKPQTLRAVIYLVEGRRRQLVLIAAALVVLALLFPPFHLYAGGQSIHLGFGFVFENHVGKVDSFFLLLELLAIGALFWLANRFLDDAANSLKN